MKHVFVIVFIKRGHFCPGWSTVLQYMKGLGGVGDGVVDEDVDVDCGYESMGHRLEVRGIP